MKLSLRTMKVGDSVQSLADDPTEGLSSAQIIHLFGKPNHIEHFKWKLAQGSHGLEKAKIYFLPNEIPNEKDADGEDWSYHNLRMSVTLTKAGHGLITNFTDVF